VRRHKDGSPVDVSVSISPIRDARGQIVGASKIARDVGARKRAQVALDQANERLREHAMVLELAPILVRDMDNRIVLWTRGAERLYGFSKEEALGRISHELFQTAFPESQEHFDLILRRTGRWEGALVHRKRDGERLVVASQQIVYHDLAGKPVRILEANADITERERVEAELSKSREQLRALADRLLKAREEEATRIARELHDQIGRHLTTIKMDVRSIERDLAGELTFEVAGILREKSQRSGIPSMKRCKPFAQSPRSCARAFSMTWVLRPPSNGRRKIFKNTQAFCVLLSCPETTHISAGIRPQPSSGFSRKS
jgi:PAS domain S-box-containing protein